MKDQNLTIIRELQSGEDVDESSEPVTDNSIKKEQVPKSEGVELPPLLSQRIEMPQISISVDEQIDEPGKSRGVSSKKASKSYFRVFASVVILFNAVGLLGLAYLYLIERWPPLQATASSQLAGDVVVNDRLDVLTKEQQELRIKYEELLPVVEGLQTENQAYAENLDQLRSELSQLQTRVVGQQEALSGVSKRLERSQEIKKQETVKSLPPATGLWVVNTGTFATKNMALEHKQDLEKSGLPLDIREANIHGKTVYRVVVTGYSDKAAALGAIDGLEKQLKTKGLWIAKEN